MPESRDAAELALVLKAIESGRNANGYCEWDQDEARRVRARYGGSGVTPEAIRELLLRHVLDLGGEVRQVLETRSEYHRRFYYKAILQVEGSAHAWFVELVLVDDDRESPVVAIVNAHEQSH